MEDINLWLAMKNGDQTALETIYRRYVKNLFSYGMRFSTNEQLVEDSIQDLFIELWTHRTNLGNTDSIIRYLMASLRRKIIRKGQQDQRYTDLDDTTPYFEAELAFDEQWIAGQDAAAAAAKLQQALNALSARQQEAIYLKYKEGLDYDDICGIMDLQYQSARNLIAHAIQKLRQLMDNLPTIILLGYLFMGFGWVQKPIPCLLY
jgi:RNA polymerase sigma factor (sigma-70 family)